MGLLHALARVVAPTWSGRLRLPRQHSAERQEGSAEDRADDGSTARGLAAEHIAFLDGDQRI